MDSLRAMFPQKDEYTLRSALERCGTVEAAVEELLNGPGSSVVESQNTMSELEQSRQMEADEILARRLQMEDDLSRNGPSFTDSIATAAQPIIDGLSSAAEAAKNAVTYVANEIMAAGSTPAASSRTHATSSSAERDPASVVQGSYSPLRNPNMHSRARRGPERTAYGGSMKKDE